MNREFFKKHFYNKLGESKFTIFSSPLFLVGLILKIGASFSFASFYLTKLFIPFLKYYSLSGFQDPYSYFYSLGVTNAFPYPRAMLFIMSLPGTIFRHFLDPRIFTVPNFEIGIYRFPILLSDIIILLILSRWLKGKDKQILWLYWLSPILFYINYLHGQLDVVPIMLLFVSLYLLFKEKWISSYVFFGIAIATKFHIVILVPFTVVYLWQKRKNFLEIFTFLSVIVFVFLLINFSSIFSLEFQKMVFGNHEQLKVFTSQIQLFDGAAVFLVPFAYFLLFFHSLTFRSFSRDLFVMFLGFSFCILIFFIPPGAGWYYWAVPFLVYFYIKNEGFSRLSFVVLNLGYFLYFLCMPKSDFLQIFQFFDYHLSSEASLFLWFSEKGIDATVVSNLMFSFLQSALLVNILWIYRRGVESSKQDKLYNVPYLIGIAGDSGSGKSTFAKSLLRIFGADNVAVFAGDDMHKWERGNEMWRKFTHLNPKANLLHGNMEDAIKLKKGESIYRRRYDHDSGEFTLPGKIEAKKVIIFEGLHSFFLERMRNMFDLKIFIVPEEQLRIHWKLLRDVKERGYSKEKVLEQIEKREKDSQEFIRTQEKYADIVISLRSDRDLKEDVECAVKFDTFLEIRCGNDIELDGFVDSLSSFLFVDLFLDDQSQRIQFRGKISGTELERISYRLVPELYDVVISDPEWSDDYVGIVELFSCYFIFKSLKLKKHGG